MSWRDDLVWVANEARNKASFREATFFVTDTDARFGRRNTPHHYIKGEVPFIEDLGGALHEFSISGYVIGNSDNDQNYFDERDALIDALKTKDRGQLIHPFLGILTVAVVGRVRMRETFREGGIARFDMAFAEGTGSVSGDDSSSTIDPGNAVDTAVTAAIADGIDGFGGIYG